MATGCKFLSLTDGIQYFISFKFETFFGYRRALGLALMAFRCCKRLQVSAIWIRNISNKPPDPPPPELCCMSGCANCVWIEYAKELKEFSNAKESNHLIDEALKKIENPSFRTSIKMEIDGILSKPTKK